MACIIHPSGAINGWNSVLKYKLKPMLTSGAVGTSVNPLWLAKEMEGKFQSSVENNFFTCPCRVLETNLPASILLPWLGREALPISYSNITAVSYEKRLPLWQIAAWFVCPTLQCIFIQNWAVGFVPRLSHLITASVTVTDDSFSVHTECEYCPKTELQSRQGQTLNHSKCPRLKNHSVTCVIVALTVLSFCLSHAVPIPLTSKHLSLITPLLLFLPLSFSLRLSLSIFPSPLVFFPLPTINVAFKMPIDLFP